MKKLLLLFLGFTIIALGVTVTIKVHYVGLEPWSSVNVGLSKFHYSYGVWNVFFQLIFLILTIFLEKRIPRIGTFVNMFYVSSMVDFFTYLDFVPEIPHGIWSYIVFVLGVFITSVGGSITIVTDLGPGAKTQFYVAVHKYFGVKLSYSKYAMELLGLTIALIFKGPIFLGTLLFIFLSGFFIGRLVPYFENIFKMKM